MSPVSFSLEGRRALVTGGASGIGQAVAVALAEAGARVAITVNRRSGLETLDRLGTAAHEGVAVRTDLQEMDGPAASALIDEAEERLEGVDVLVNNAGIIRRSPADKYPEDDWRAVLSVNLDALWLLSQEAGKRMLERGNGSIINIASLLSFQGGVRVPAYAAAKHAVAGVTKALANEWAGRGVNVNAIAPGYIATDNTAPLRNDQVRNEQIVKRIPAGRWGAPEDIAGAAVFLASPAATYVHGHILAVDGGWLAN